MSFFSKAGGSSTFSSSYGFSTPGFSASELACMLRPSSTALSSFTSKNPYTRVSGSASSSGNSKAFDCMSTTSTVAPQNGRLTAEKKLHGVLDLSFGASPSFSRSL